MTSTPSAQAGSYQLPGWATPEQRQIIEHTDGHALVFAVAGSGKSTSLIERSERLVTAGYRPDQVLLTTFSRDARASLVDKLRGRGAASRIQPRTLHALAHLIISEARRAGLTDMQVGPANFARRLLEEARRAVLRDIGDLGLDDDKARKLASEVRAVSPEDFLTYLGVEKGALRMATVPSDLPPELQAKVYAPLGERSYQLLYAKHDELREAQGWLDFDDSIVHAWMVLGSAPEFTAGLQGRWPQIMVDEYQDVSVAQAEMLHLLGSGARCYMAIGDDDQTVYQWRGASPEMILGFQKRYGARVMLLSHNWRCPLDVVALSAGVIRGNQVRARKEMRATHSHTGVRLHATNHPRAVGELIDRLLRQGQDPEELAVLLRTYAQSAPIEEVLIERRIPYRLVGNVPFYTRQEVRVLMDYIELAQAEADWLGGARPDAEEQTRLAGVWARVAGRPARYFKSSDIQDLGRAAYRQRSLVELLELRAKAHSSGRDKYLGTGYGNLAAHLSWLARQLKTPQGDEVLRQFAAKLGYREHLIKTAPSREFGEERAQSVDALCRMAQGRPLGALAQHLAELRELALHLDDRVQQNEDQDYREDLQGAQVAVPRLTITSAYRAKGLEWDTVIVPGVSADIYRPGKRGTPAEREEERRVLYVAMTRPRRDLHLFYEPGNASPFLLSAGHEALVADHRRMLELSAELSRPAPAPRGLLAAWQSKASELLHGDDRARQREELQRLMNRYGHDPALLAQSPPEPRDKGLNPA